MRCGRREASHVPAAPDARLIGCGGLGLWSLRVMTSVFPSIQQVFVSSRTRESRERFCANMSREGSWRIAAVDDPLQAVRDVDIVVSSMPPADVKPVSADALTPGTLFIPLDLVNSWQDNVLAAIDRVAADNPTHFAAQVQSRRAPAFPLLKHPTSIQDVVAGKSPRVSSSQRALIAVCGIASTDVVVGWEIYRRARAANVGLEFDMQG